MSHTYRITIDMEFPDPDWRPHQEGTCSECYGPLPDPPMYIQTEPGFEDASHPLCSWGCTLMLAAKVVAASDEGGKGFRLRETTFDTLGGTGLGTGIPPEGP